MDKNEQLVLYIEPEGKQSLNSFIDKLVKLKDKYKYVVVGNYYGRAIKVAETDDFRSVRHRYIDDLQNKIKIVS